MKTLTRTMIIVIVAIAAAGCGNGSDPIADLSGTWHGSGEAIVDNQGEVRSVLFSDTMTLTKIDETTYRARERIVIPELGFDQTVDSIIGYRNGVLYQSGLRIGTAYDSTITLDYTTTIEGMKVTVSGTYHRG
ncbi:hypothetical protein ES707_08445 [subsurface metagenome]